MMIKSVVDVHASMGNLDTSCLRNHSTIGKGRIYVEKEIRNVEQNLGVLRLSQPGLFLSTLSCLEQKKGILFPLDTALFRKIQTVLDEAVLNVLVLV